MGAAGHAIALDAGALIALETSRGRALLRELVSADRPVVISAGALGQVWRDGARQALLSALLRHRHTVVAVLDEPAAKACGRLLARAGSRDLVDAHVVLSAREHGAHAVITSDEYDLRALDPRLTLHRI